MRGPRSHQQLRRHRPASAVGQCSCGRGAHRTCRPPLREHHPAPPPVADAGHLPHPWLRRHPLSLTLDLAPTFVSFCRLRPTAQPVTSSPRVPRAGTRRGAVREPLRHPPTLSMLGRGACGTFPISSGGGGHRQRQQLPMGLIQQPGGFVGRTVLPLLPPKLKGSRPIHCGASGVRIAKPALSALREAQFVSQGACCRPTKRVFCLCFLR